MPEAGSRGLRSALAGRLLVPGAGMLFSRRTRRLLVLSVLGSVVTALLDMAGIATLVPLMQVISGAEGGAVLDGVRDLLGSDLTDRQVAIRLAIIIVVLFALKSSLTIAFRWWQIGFVAREQVATSTLLLRSYLLAPYRQFVQRSIPDYVRNLGNAIMQTYGQVVLGCLGLAAEAFTITAIALLVLVVSPVPALVAFCYFALSAFAMNRLVRHRVTRAGEDVLEHSTRSFQVVFSTLHGAKEIKVRNNAETFVQLFRTAQQEQALASRRFSFLGELPKHVLELLFVGGVALMTVISLAQADPDTALTQLVLFAAAGTRILPSTIRLLANLSSVRFGLPGMRLVVDDMHEFHAGEAERAVAVPPGPPRRGEIRVERVSYRYDADATLVVDDVSLTIPQGTSLAVVGSSGAGKTTLIDLVLGLLEPTSGRICVDGEDIRDDLPSWQRGIGLVPQHPYLFDDTLAANVAFGRPLDDDARSRVRAERREGRARRRPRPPARGPRRAPRGGGLAALGWSGAADRHRARTVRRPVRGHPRRGHLGARHGDRAPGLRLGGRVARFRDRHHRGAPALDGPVLRPAGVPRERQGRGDRHLRPGARVKRRLRANGRARQHRPSCRRPDLRRLTGSQGLRRLVDPLGPARPAEGVAGGGRPARW